MACIYLLNSCGDPRSLDFVITTYSYPLRLGHWIITSPHYVVVGMPRRGKSTKVTPKAQLRLRVKFCLGDKLKDRIID